MAGVPVYRDPKYMPTLPGQSIVSVPSSGGGYGYAASPPPAPAAPAMGSSMLPSMAALTGGGSGFMSAPSYSGGQSVSQGPLSQPGYERQQQTQLEFDLRRQESEAKQKRFEQIMSQLGAGQAPPARATRTGGPTEAQETAARDAAFARAKERAGQTARASMTTLQDVVDERGLMGSSVEAGRAGNIVGQAASGIGEFLRDQAQSEAQRATDVANLEYTGQIQQRGQELARQQALLGLLVGGLY